MPRLPLPEREPEAPSTPEELFGRLQVVDEGLENLWSQQADVLRSYAEDHGETADVALELPTGSGKTLVGLLIGEWRRQSLGHRVAYLCPNNQLARQVHAKAAGYGIDSVLLVGPSDGWDTPGETRFTQNRSIAITNYHHVFNRTPRILAQTLVLDDAHTAEGPIANRWSLVLDREKLRDGYFAVVEAILGELPDHHGSALVRDDLDPVHRAAVEVLMPDAVHRVEAQLSTVIPEYVEGTDAWYAWDAIRENLGSCLVYAAWNQILIRPFIAPTFSQDAFDEASQRVYLSATLGAGGELERSFGRTSVDRIPQPADWDREGSGRRFMLAPGAGHDGEAANKVIKAVVDEIGRVLFLSPSNWRMERAADALLPDDLERLGAPDIEESLEPFTSRERVALLLANRYDGIDLPGQACRLIILSGLPYGTHLQERFLFEVLGARHALGERIRTRITQGAGRATRARRDTAVVVLHADDLIGFLLPSDTRSVLRSELQAELELGFSIAELPTEEVIGNVRSFLDQDEDWRPTEAWLRTYAQDHRKEDPPASDRLTEAVQHEVLGCQAAWRGDYVEAVAAGQRAPAALNHPETSQYRAWWVSLAASWSSMASGSDARRTRGLAREAGLATRQMRWRPTLATETDALSPDEAIGARAAATVQWVRRWQQSPRLERMLGELEGNIGSNDSTRFELGLKLLGTVLGFDAERPAAEADPDGVWRDGSQAWFVWEAKSEELATGKLSATEVRQANSHPDWVRHHYVWPEPADVLTLIVTPKTELHPNAAGLPAEHVHLVTLEAVREIAAAGIEVVRQLAGELLGLTDDQAIARVATLWSAQSLTTPELVGRLSEEPLR